MPIVPVNTNWLLPIGFPVVASTEPLSSMVIVGGVAAVIVGALIGGSDIAAKVRDSVVRPTRSVATFTTPKAALPTTLMLPGLYTRQGGQDAEGGSGANLTWPPMVPTP